MVTHTLGINVGNRGNKCPGRGKKGRKEGRKGNANSP